MHLVKSSGNKPSSIPKPILTPGMATNQAGSPSISSNNANASGSGRENAVAIDSAVKNKETRESNGDATVGLEVQPNIATTASIFY